MVCSYAYQPPLRRVAAKLYQSYHHPSGVPKPYTHTDLPNTWPLKGMIPFTETGINRRYPLNPSSSSRAFGTCVVCLPPILPPPTRTWPNHDLWVWASWQSRTHLCCCYLGFAVYLIGVPFREGNMRYLLVDPKRSPTIFELYPCYNLNKWFAHL